jgi:3-deoxy-7-phosphoheptulonate synthase
VLVILDRGAQSPQIDDIQRTLIDLGYGVHAIVGAERTVIAATGGPLPGEVETAERLRALAGVVEVHEVDKPYRLAALEAHPDGTVVRVGNVPIGAGQPVVVLAGPCTVESREQTLQTAHAVKALGATILRGGAYKPSTSPYGFPGLGIAGLEILAEARAETGLPVITEVMDPRAVETVCGYADMLQIGTRNMQNYDLLREVGRCHTPVCLKRGMSATIAEWLQAAEYILLGGNPNVVLCERGVRTFETHTRNTLDLAAVPALKALTHLPVMVDPSQGTGRAALVSALCRGAVAVGADALLIEVHPDPARALKDGPQQLTPPLFGQLMNELRPVAAAVGRSLAV